MNFKSITAAILVACATATSSAVAQSTPALNDPNTVITVMQVTANDKDSISKLKQHLSKIAQYIDEKSSAIDHVFMENFNADASPHFVGLSRWQSTKDWETLWLDPEFQKLVTASTPFGAVKPGKFKAIK